MAQGGVRGIKFVLAWHQHGRHVHLPTASQKPPTVPDHTVVRVRVVQFWAMEPLYRVTQVPTLLPNHLLSVYVYAVSDWCPALSCGYTVSALPSVLSETHGLCAARCNSSTVQRC